MTRKKEDNMISSDTLLLNKAAEAVALAEASAALAEQIWETFLEIFSEISLAAEAEGDPIMVP